MNIIFLGSSRWVGNRPAAYIWNGICSRAGIQKTIERKEAAPEAAPKSEFVWSKNWYPVAVASLLEKDKPNKVTLLGRDYVVWFADDMWNAAKDECPHRCEPYSANAHCRYPF
jgi:hypothetical protein